MNVTTRNPVKKERFIFDQMNKEFAKGYEGKIGNADKSAKSAWLANRDTIRFIECDGKVVGYYSLLFVSSAFNGRQFKLIRDMYVEPNSRNKGIAALARISARNNDIVHGIMISWGRAKKNIDYFRKQGFNKITIDPHEGAAEDQHLCLLLSNDEHYQTFPVMDLNMFDLNELQAVYKQTLKSN
jgi:GNAT superfamily N-acetyltransferase